jgi:hypothetical protein
MPFSDFRRQSGNHPSPARDAGAQPLSARRHSFRSARIGQVHARADARPRHELPGAALYRRHRTADGGLPDFCGHCSNCARIAQSEDLDARFAEAVEARENLRDTDKKETRLFVQTHPDVLIIPPDPPQMMIKVDQVRHVIETIYYRPAEARERVYIFTSSAFMKEAANSLLKVLEEPPEFATIFLLTENAGELLPTIRSRSMTFNLGALASLGDREPSRPASSRLECPAARAGRAPQRRRHRTRFVISTSKATSPLATTPSSC